MHFKVFNFFVMPRLQNQHHTISWPQRRCVMLLFMQAGCYCRFAVSECSAQCCSLFQTSAALQPDRAAVFPSTPNVFKLSKLSSVCASGINLMKSPLPSSPTFPSNAPALTLDVDGVILNVNVTEMQYCRHTKVIIRLPAQSATPAQEVDTDTVGSGIGVDVFAVLWTNSSAAGMPCDDIKGADCKQLIRQMPLVYSAVDDALVAILVPDSSSAHYSFVVQVSPFHCPVCIAIH